MIAIWKCAINSTKTRKTKMHALPLGDLIPECVQQGETETKAYRFYELPFFNVKLVFVHRLFASPTRNPPPAHRVSALLQYVADAQEESA